MHHLAFEEVLLEDPWLRSKVLEVVNRRVSG